MVLLDLEVVVLVEQEVVLITLVVAVVVCAHQLELMCGQVVKVLSL